MLLFLSLFSSLYPLIRLVSVCLLLRPSSAITSANVHVFSHAPFLSCLFTCLLSVILSPFNPSAWLLVITPDRNNVTCQLRLWTFTLSFTLLFAPLFLKTVRVHPMFQASLKPSLSLPPPVPDSLLFRGLAFFLLLPLLILIVQLIFDDIRSEFVEHVIISPGIKQNGQVAYQCTTSGIILSLLAGLALVSLLICMLLCWAVSLNHAQTPYQYNDSRSVSHCVKLILFYSVFVLVLQFVLEHQLTTVACVRAIGIIAGVLACQCTLMMPKIFILFAAKEDEPLADTEPSTSEDDPMREQQREQRQCVDHEHNPIAAAPCQPSPSPSPPLPAPAPSLAKQASITSNKRQSSQHSDHQHQLLRHASNNSNHSNDSNTSNSSSKHSVGLGVLQFSGVKDPSAIAQHAVELSQSHRASGNVYHAANQTQHTSCASLVRASSGSGTPVVGQPNNQ